MSKPKLDVRNLAFTPLVSITLALHFLTFCAKCVAQPPEIATGAVPRATNLGEDPLERYRSKAERWRDEIVALERLNAEETIDPACVLFLGSSSIRLWESIQDDMKPISVIRRGFGGAMFSDLAVYLPRIVPSAAVQSVVIFVANDIRGESDDKSADEIVQLVAHMVGQLREIQPTAKVYLIAITPTRARWSVWPQIRQANMAMQSYCERSGMIQFIRTEDLFLNSDSQPREELFQDDRLHLNREGYRVWSSRIREYLNNSGSEENSQRKSG